MRVSAYDRSSGWTDQCAQTQQVPCYADGVFEKDKPGSVGGQQTA